MKQQFHIRQKIIDLSVALDNDVHADPPGLGPTVKYIDHDQGAIDFSRMFGVPVHRQLEGKGAAVEQVELTTHNGTHMDAPWHYHPTMNGGERALTIDEIPLNWCIGHGVKLDFRKKPDGHIITPDDIVQELLRIDYCLQEDDIVLVNTRAGERYGYADYCSSGCGFGREATLWMTSHGVKVCGTDAWSWDPPLQGQAAAAKATDNYQLFWEAHKAGAECVYCHMEKLTNLHLLPDHGFQVIALPIKVARGSAGWCRTIAIVGN